jgi:membrane-associated protease RseP (regulator of RpoE activity)
MNLPLPRAALSLLLGSTLLAQSAPTERPQDPPEPPSRVQTDLGIEFAVKTSKLRRAMIRTTTPYGFAVRAVAKGSLADLAGLTKGAIVLTVDGAPLREVADLEAVLAKAAPGQKVVLKCSRYKKNARLLDRHPWEDFEVTLVIPAAPRKSV